MTKGAETLFNLIWPSQRLIPEEYQFVDKFIKIIIKLTKAHIKWLMNILKSNKINLHPSIIFNKSI